MFDLKFNNYDFFIGLYCSFSIFLFSALSLIVPSGYSYGASLLFLGSIVLFIKKQRLDLQNHEWAFFCVLISYFFVNFFSNMYHNLPPSSYDKSFRYLLVLPVYILLISKRPSEYLFWLGLGVGALGAGCIAFYQQVFNSHWSGRATGFLNAIQFGDISTLVAGLLIPGFLWCSQNRHKYLLIFLIVSCCMGFLASFLSSSRGGWIAIPLILLVLYLINAPDVRKKILFYFILFCSATVLVLIVLPGSNTFKNRLLITGQEINEYIHPENRFTSINMRTTMWKNGYEAFKEKPIFGWGDLTSVKLHFPLSWKKLAEQDNYKHLHNEYIDELVKKGIIGFVSLMALYVISLYYFIRLLRKKIQKVIPFAAAGIILILCVMTFGLTQCFLAHNSGTMSLVFYLVIIKAYCRNICTNHD